MSEFSKLLRKIERKVKGAVSDLRDEAHKLDLDDYDDLLHELLQDRGELKALLPGPLVVVLEVLAERGKKQ